MAACWNQSNGGVLDRPTSIFPRGVGVAQAEDEAVPVHTVTCQSMRKHEYNYCTRCCPNLRIWNKKAETFKMEMIRVSEEIGVPASLLANCRP